MKNVLTWIGLLLSICSYSQKAGENVPRLLDSAQFHQFTNYSKSIGLLDRAEESIHADGLEKNLTLLIRAYQIRVMTTRYFSYPQLSRQYLLKEDELINQFKRTLGPAYDERKRELTMSWAQFYFDVDDYNKSLELFLELLKVTERLPRSTMNCYNLYIITQYIAEIQNQTGELEASINQYLTCITYYECFAKKNPTDYALIFRNVGSRYLTIGAYSKARIFLNRSQDSLISLWNRSLNKSAPAATAIVLLETLSHYYREKRQYDSALTTLQKAEYYLKYSERFRGRYYLALAETYETLGNFQLAGEFYLKAIEFFIKSSGEKNILLANAYFKAGRLAEKQSRLAEAASYYQKAIASLVLDFNPRGQENPTLTNILSKKQLFVSLQMKSRLMEKLYQRKKGDSLLQQAWQVNQLSMALIDSTANEFTLDKDKIILAEQSYGAYEDGIRMAYQLLLQTGEEKYFTDCFSLADKSKGILLLENLRLVNRFAGINPEWLDQEKDLKSELLFSEQAVYESEIKKRSADEVNTARGHYASAKREYAALINKIKKEAPDYYRLRFDRSVITSDFIQGKMLRQGEALIEYFVGDSSLAVFGFSKDHRYGNVKKIIPDFTAKINEVRRFLTTAEALEPGEDFQNKSKELYDFLIRDCLKALGPGITSITIIPDGALGYLPFEILVKKSNAHDPDYLVSQYSIHYANSASYLKEQLERKSPSTKYFFAGFISPEAAPSGNQLTTSLPGAKKEVAAIAELIGSDFSIFNPASKNDFKMHAQDYRIIHLAMHSLLNDENPMLSVMVFSPSVGDSLHENQLNAIELYNMHLKSELAVLSACNTGMGQVHRGEGILSFARAFAYAGVPSALISLWQVPDKATSRIMVNFYRHLKEGQSKDRALQMAKKDFIKNYPQMAHPYYWSGFILTGNAEPIEFPSSWRWVLWWGAISLIALGVVVTKRKKINQTWKKIKGII